MATRSVPVALGILLAGAAFADVTPDGKWDCGYDYNVGHYSCKPFEGCDPLNDEMCRRNLEARASVGFAGTDDRRQRAEQETMLQSDQRAMEREGCWNPAFMDPLRRLVVVGAYRAANIDALYSREPTPPAWYETIDKTVADGFNCCAQRAEVSPRVPERPAPPSTCAGTLSRARAVAACVAGARRSVKGVVLSDKPDESAPARTSRHRRATTTFTVSCRNEEFTCEAEAGVARCSTRGPR